MKKINILKNSRDFDRIIKNNTSYKYKDYIFYLEKNTKDVFKFGLSVGKKIGNAVTRNAIKRKIRQSLLELKPMIKADIDFIVIARPPTAEMSTEEVKKSLIHVLKLAHVME